ncbi:hypothetical protein [Bradyrhizobium japonicum]|uniref:hypothetical protein n=1 Tax=Bradyrhizobium japonicum TaxID=375 RepID=UPI0027146B8E|nr:hypothetical protein [Bradyrhizobium japonicum]WLB14996.1 hypothetical protein QIH95_23275 [Bradyrhizobium japonicum]
MLVKVEREFLDDMGKVKAGRVLDLTDWHAQQLIGRGLVTEVQGDAAAHGARHPISSPTSCQAGAANVPSSSDPDRAPPASSASSPAEAAASASSPSTIVGGSVPMPMSPMPATAPGGKPGKGSRQRSPD